MRRNDGMLVDDVMLGNRRTRRVRCRFRLPVCFPVLRNDGRLPCPWAPT